MSITVPQRPISEARAPRDTIVVANDLPSHTVALQRAIDACSAAGGGRVVLKPGVFRSGTLVLRSGVALHLEKDAVLLGSANIAEYHYSVRPLEARMLGGVATALVYADGADNIGLTGEGVIDGNGQAFCRERTARLDWVEEKRRMGLWIPGFDVQSRERPRALVLFAACTRVRFATISLRNAPAWMVHLLACRDVSLTDVTIRGRIHGANTDGIDLDGCSDVRVEGCDIETGDDAIALKNTGSWGLQRPSRRIAIRGCRLASTTHGFTIGTETRDDFEDITLGESTIEGAGGYRVLTGIGLDVVDGGSVNNVRISHVSIDGAIAPVHIRIGNAGRGQAIRVPGSIRDVRLEDIAITGASGNCLLTGLPGHPLRGIALCNVTLEFTGTLDGARPMTVVPEQDGEFPSNESWRLLPAFGFFGRHIEGLELSEIEFMNRSADTRPAILLQDVCEVSEQDIR